jgi:hypothetical protein
MFRSRITLQDEASALFRKSPICFFSLLFWQRNKTLSSKKVPASRVSHYRAHANLPNSQLLPRSINHITY